MLHLRTLAAAPTVNPRDDRLEVVWIRCVLHDPVDGTEEIHTEGRLEAFDSYADTGPLHPNNVASWKVSSSLLGDEA